MISFVNSFLSYLLLFAVIAALGAVAIAIGIAMRKKKNAASEVEEATPEAKTE